ncbi:MAG: glycosyltransferase family 4 protein [Planctomycetes bacterium]|nr:glycosyltransferase family 4 protein [Planctomycetota bacterium]
MRSRQDRPWSPSSTTSLGLLRGGSPYPPREGAGLHCAAAAESRRAKAQVAAEAAWAAGCAASAHERGRLKKLGIIVEMYGARHLGSLYCHASIGRVIDRLATRAEQAVLCLPVQDAAPDATRDYRLQAANVRLVPQPFYRSSFQALWHLAGIAGAYGRTCRAAEHIFVRGMLPFVGVFYLLAWMCGCRVCHWIVGDPVGSLRSHRRAGWLKDHLFLLYAWQERLLARLGRRLTGGAFVCNGEALASIYRSPRTVAAVSSTLTEEEFFVRADTCQSPAVRILFVGFIRPEKGLEYLIEAVALLPAGRPWELVLVGPRDQYPDYVAGLDGIARRLGVGHRIRWTGYVPYGPQMFRWLHESDVLVLPSVSEGTPRILLEARANSLPVVATRVGGVPTSVTDGADGLLVPPKDPAALARAVGRIIEDGRLRQSLIASGLQTARHMTLDRFVEAVVQQL